MLVEGRVTSQAEIAGAVARVTAAPSDERWKRELGTSRVLLANACENGPKTVRAVVSLSTAPNTQWVGLKSSNQSISCFGTYFVPGLDTHRVTQYRRLEV